MIMLTAAALVAASPATAPSATRVTTVTFPAKAAANGNDLPDFAKVMAMIDKFFPVQPDPDPRLLGLARGTSQVMLPPGAFSKGLTDYLGGYVDHVLALKASDFAEFDKSIKIDGTKPNLTLRDQLIADDPYFAEREKLTRAAVVTELDRLSIAVEPKLREGLARTMAHRFTEQQLADINAFMATDSGRALGKNFLGMWFDPELARAMFSTMPDWIMAMPGAAQRIEAATAHLPKPPKNDSRPIVKAAPAPKRK